VAAVVDHQAGLEPSKRTKSLTSSAPHPKVSFPF
jgi:hypothetical protein